MQNRKELEQSKYQILAPITSPDKVACIGMNYKDHCQEQGAPIPLEPLVFCKFPSCIIGPFDNIPYPTDISTVGLNHFYFFDGFKSIQKLYLLYSNRSWTGKQNLLSSLASKVKTLILLRQRPTYLGIQWRTT